MVYIFCQDLSSRIRSAAIQCCTLFSTLNSRVSAQVWLSTASSTATSATRSNCNRSLLRSFAKHTSLTFIFLQHLPLFVFLRSPSPLLSNCSSIRCWPWSTTLNSSTTRLLPPFSRPMPSLAHAKSSLRSPAAQVEHNCYHSRSDAVKRMHNHAKQSRISSCRSVSLSHRNVFLLQELTRRAKELRSPEGKQPAHLFIIQQDYLLPSICVSFLNSRQARRRLHRGQRWTPCQRRRHISNRRYFTAAYVHRSQNQTRLKVKASLTIEFLL